MELSGRIQVRETGLPIAGLEVVVLRAPRDEEVEQRLMAGVTDENGNFSFQLDAEIRTTVRVDVLAPRGDPGEPDDRLMYRTREEIDLRRGPEFLSIALPAQRVRALDLPSSDTEHQLRAAAIELAALESARPLNERIAAASAVLPAAITRRTQETRFRQLRQSAAIALDGLNLRRRSDPVQDDRRILEVAEVERAAQALTQTTNAFLERFSLDLPALTLPLSVAAVERLGLAQDGIVLDMDALRNAMSAARLPPLAERSATIGLLCPHDEAPAPEDPPAPDPPEEPAPADEVNAESLRGKVLNLLDAQLLDLSPRRDAELRHDTQSLHRSLFDLDVATGPADAPAFHDFTTLQIAKQELRARLLDQEIQGIAIEVHTIYFEMLTADGGEAEPEPLPDVDALEAFLSEIDSYLERNGARGSKATVAPTYEWVDEDEGIARKIGGGLMQAPVASADNNRSAHLTRLRNLLTELRQRLHARYSFEVYHPSDVNFGLVITYRQEWTPLQYQVGELVGTVPLAPGESRKTTFKTTVKRRRSEQVIDQSLRARRSEQDVKTSAHSDIASRAQEKSNFGFKASASGTFFGFGKWGTETSYSKDKARESQKKKRQIRDATKKAAEEYKQERKTQVSVDEESVIDEATEAQIANPNNEIPVTYLFYELQRRYDVTERLHSVQPVVLIPMPVPRPDEITDAWLLRHDWILRRVLLDDQFGEPLIYLRNGLSSDLAQLAVLEKQFKVRLQAVKSIQTDVQLLEAKVRLQQGKITRSTLMQRIAKKYLIDQSDFRWLEHWGFEDRIDPFVLDVLKDELANGQIPAEGIDDNKVWEAQLEASSQSLNYTQDELADLRARHAALTATLEDAQEAYRKALTAYFEKTTKIAQLRLHVRDNILHYMQAIWNHEPPDQRWMRLRNREIPFFDVVPNQISINSAPAPQVVLGNVGLSLDGDVLRLHKVSPNQQTKVASGTGAVVNQRSVDLVDVADLDNPLGYHGNYLVLRLREPNALTQYMLSDYYCDVLGICDPDPFGVATPEELRTLAACLDKHHIEGGAQMRDELRRMADGRLRTGDGPETIVLPSEHIYIEALPGSHPVLEDFKLKHRAVDVAKARAEARQLEIDNLRRVHRIADQDLDDPEVDKHIVVDGANFVVNEDLGDNP